ncbi:MAG TPA: PaaI family thioesterase [Acidimicrobiia bacterium]|nr:PaaI family thioesterase [Acidimicrobiia bacterium]
MHTDPGPTSFVGALNAELWVEDGATRGRVAVLPEMLAPGTDRVRMGVLATLVDLVAGSLPSGPVNPTVDLRVSLIGRPPATGTISLVCHPAKVGRRLFVGETLLHTGDERRPFARATTTFMNELIPGVTGVGPPTAPVGAPSFDDLLRPRAGDRGAVEVDPHPWVSNGVGGTIQGGALALLAEIAAERAVEDATGEVAEVVDLDIRYVNRVRAGPVAASAEASPREFGDFLVRVAITDLGDGGRLVSIVSLVCRPTG